MCKKYFIGATIRMDAMIRIIDTIIGIVVATKRIVDAGNKFYGAILPQLD